MFNASLAEGILPDVWKDGYLIPIFKSGNRELVKNYRGVCIKSVVPKIFDLICSPIKST